MACTVPRARAPSGSIELHGTNAEGECLGCRRREPIGACLERFEASGEPPRCTSCAELMKPAVVMFGQSLEPETLRRANAAAERADLVLVARVVPDGDACGERAARGRAAACAVRRGQPWRDAARRGRDLQARHGRGRRRAARGSGAPVLPVTWRWFRPRFRGLLRPVNARIPAVLPIVETFFSYLREHPEELLRVLRNALALRFGVPIAGLRWLATRVNGKRAPKDVRDHRRAARRARGRSDRSHGYRRARVGHRLRRGHSHRARDVAHRASPERGVAQAHRRVGREPDRGAC